MSPSIRDQGTALSKYMNIPRFLLVPNQTYMT